MTFCTKHVYVLWCDIKMSTKLKLNIFLCLENIYISTADGYIFKK
jgi:hypothetical protein